MNIDISALVPHDAAARADAAPTPPDVQRAAAQLGPAVRVDTMPSSPPPEVWSEIQDAAARYDELRASGRQLHFETSSAGRVRVEVQDLDGKVLRRIPATEVLSVISGKPLE